MLRAIATKDGYLPSNIDTQTYLFVDDIVRQDYQATRDAGFPSSWGPYSPDYGMDPDVIGNFDADGNSTGGDLFGGIYVDDDQGRSAGDSDAVDRHGDRRTLRTQRDLHERDSARRGLGAGDVGRTDHRMAARASRSTPGSASRAARSARTA